jgi:phosphoserine aminotransferase
MEQRNRAKAEKLYAYLDQSRLFKPTADRDSRSLMNVTFVTGNEELDAKFVKAATSAGLEGLKGHRSVGGMRASIYNAFPIEGVDALIALMKDFEAKNS